MQRVTLCSCLKQVMESLLLVSGSSEHVGGVWHKQGFQLAEPGTDGTGKWGTSLKHWNLLQRPSTHFSLTLLLLNAQSIFSSVNDLCSPRFLKSCRCVVYKCIFFLMIMKLVQKAAGRWECLASYLHNTRCFGSSAGMSFCSPGWSQQMAGLGSGISREGRQKGEEKRHFSSLALARCVALIHHVEVATYCKSGSMEAFQCITVWFV